jgi:hypothetical protein
MTPFARALMGNPTTGNPTTGLDEVYNIPGMPAGCCDNAAGAAGFGNCLAGSPVAQCGGNGAVFPLAPNMAKCRGLWTWPPTFDSALKYCMCMQMPNGACYNNVRSCLACMNNTHTGGANPAPPYPAGTGLPAGGCFVIPVSELYCYDNVGCTLWQQAKLGARVACQLPVCTAWATAQCLAAGTC